MKPRMGSFFEMSNCMFFMLLGFFGCFGFFGCAQAFPSCRERGLLFHTVHGLLIVVASLVVDHGL